MKRQQKIKPERGWALIKPNGKICVDTISRTRMSAVAQWVNPMFWRHCRRLGYRVVRVRIVPEVGR